KLVKTLRIIAKETQSCFLITKLGAYPNEDPYDDQVVPALPPSIRQELHHSLFFEPRPRKFRLMYRAPDAFKHYRIAHPPKRLSLDQESPSFLSEVIWNLENLEKLPLLTPEHFLQKDTVATQSAPLGWKEKLLENPTLHVTSYGLTFMTWRFKESIEGIHIILRTEPTERHFDLVQWKDHSYNIYNSVIDLHSFERLGGVPRGKGKYQGRGMRFDPAADGVRPFEEFIRFVHENPIPFRPVPRSPDEK
ncbi:MAG: hypothetical protein ACTSYB_16425, partial [Candidatus Helarchaeota archaeon]